MYVTKNMLIILTTLSMLLNIFLAYRLYRKIVPPKDKEGGQPPTEEKEPLGFKQ